MRYTLFGEAQGVMASCTTPLWGAVQNSIIQDASVSAREQGIRAGMSEKSAKALLPSIELCPVSAEPEPVMKSIWQVINNFTPWLEPVGNSGFYAELPKYTGTSEEVRNILSAVDRELFSTQRVRTGMAESKQTARALVEWSKRGHISGAGFFTVGGQQLIVSPSILQEPEGSRDSSWIRGFPIAAMWMIPKRYQQELMSLGITTLGQLQDVPEENLRLRFGKEFWFWKHYFDIGTQVLHLNQKRPLLHRKAEVADETGSVDISLFLVLAEALAERLSEELISQGLGVRRIKLCWETDEEKDCLSLRFDRLLYTQHAIWAHLEPHLTDVSGIAIEDMELYGEEYSPLQGTQAAFRVYERQVLPVQYGEAEKLDELMSRVNKKFPYKLQRGLTSGFRELRLEAMGEL